MEIVVVTPYFVEHVNRLISYGGRTSWDYKQIKITWNWHLHCNISCTDSYSTISRCKNITFREVYPCFYIYCTIIYIMKSLNWKLDIIFLILYSEVITGRVYKMFGVTQRLHEAMLMDARVLDVNDIRRRQLATLWPYILVVLTEFQLGYRNGNAISLND